MSGDKDKKLGWLTGGIMIGVATIFDLVNILLGFTHFIPIFGSLFVLSVAWIPNLFAFLTFSLWFTLQGKANWKRLAILIAPFTAGCTGLPGWTATIWPVVAKIVAAETIEKVAPAGVGRIATRALKKI